MGKWWGKRQKKRFLFSSPAPSSSKKRSEKCHRFPSSTPKQHSVISDVSKVEENSHNRVDLFSRLNKNDVNKTPKEIDDGNAAKRKRELEGPDLARIQLAALFFSRTWGQDKSEFQCALSILQAHPVLAGEWFLGKFPGSEKKMSLPPIHHFSRASGVDVQTMRAVGEIYPSVLDDNWSRLDQRTPLWVASSTNGISNDVITHLIKAKYGLVSSKRQLCPIHAHLKKSLSSQPSTDFEPILETFRKLQTRFKVQRETVELVVREKSRPLLLELLAESSRVAWDQELCFTKARLDMGQALGLVTILPKIKNLKLRLDWRNPRDEQVWKFVMQSLELHTTQVEELDLALPADSREVASYVESFLGNTQTLRKIKFDGLQEQSFEAMIRGLKFQPKRIQEVDVWRYSQLTSASLVALIQTGIESLRINKCVTASSDTAFKESLSSLSESFVDSHLTKLHFWSTSFSEDTFRSFSDIVKTVPGLQHLFLDLKPETEPRNADFTEPLISIMKVEQLQLDLAIRENFNMPTFCCHLQGSKVHRLQLGEVAGRPSNDLHCLKKALLNTCSVAKFNFFPKETTALSTERVNALAVMEYAAHLNRAGRRTIRQLDTSCAQLIDLLVAAMRGTYDSVVAHHLQESLIYGLLREIPSLWATGNRLGGSSRAGAVNGSTSRRWCRLVASGNKTKKSLRSKKAPTLTLGN